MLLLIQVVLPEGMASEPLQSAAGLHILSGELMVTERTVEQVQKTSTYRTQKLQPACNMFHCALSLCV